MRLRQVILIVLASFLCLAQAPLAFSEGEPAQAERKYELGGFAFTNKNMRDPFEPVYLLKARKLRMGQANTASTAQGRVGLKEGYELEELKLVGVIQKENIKYAMMEDLQGKGVLFKKGDKINQQMWIVDVVDSRAVIGYRTKRAVKTIEIEIQKK